MVPMQTNIVLWVVLLFVIFAGYIGLRYLISRGVGKAVGAAERGLRKDAYAKGQEFGATAEAFRVPLAPQQAVDSLLQALAPAAEKPALKGALVVDGRGPSNLNLTFGNKLTTIYRALIDASPDGTGAQGALRFTDILTDGDSKIPQGVAQMEELRDKVRGWVQANGGSFQTVPRV